MLSSLFISNTAWEAGIPAAGAAASWDTDLTHVRTRMCTHTHGHTHTHGGECVKYLQSPAHADIKRTGSLSLDPNRRGR